MPPTPSPRTPEKTSRARVNISALCTLRIPFTYSNYPSNPTQSSFFFLFFRNQVVKTFSNQKPHLSPCSASISSELTSSSSPPPAAVANPQPLESHAPSPPPPPTNLLPPQPTSTTSKPSSRHPPGPSNPSSPPQIQIQIQIQPVTTHRYPKKSKSRKTSCTTCSVSPRFRCLRRRPRSGG